MTAITREFRLYTNAGLSIPPVIHVNQYDQGETWNFKLYQPNGQQFIPTDAAIVGVKADGNLIANAGTVSDGVVVITETEQMTAAPGKAVFEILFDGDTHGTANFVVLVEPSPTNDGVASESDLSLFQEAIDSTSPAAIAQGVSAWMSEHLTPTTPVVDDTLTVQGAAADAKKTGDEISDLKSAITNGVPYAVKIALDNILQNVAFKNDDGYSSDLSVIHNWATSVSLVSISAVFTQGDNAIYETDSLDSLKQYLVVTASYDNGTTATLADSAYTLSGTLTVGTSTITVTYDGKTATFNVTVSAPTREMLFGVFSNGYTTIKANSSSSYPTLGKHCYRQATAARACTQVPFANANQYLFTVTDSTKYNILVDDITDNDPVSVPLITQAVDGKAYHAGDKSVSWQTSDSVTTSYGWIALKKLDNTAFTDAELANGAEAVFTYTEVS